MIIARSPHPELLQWDENACEAACTAQILYTAKKLDVPFDTRDFDYQIGREPRLVNATNGCALVLMDAGIRIHRIDPVDSDRMAGDINYSREVAQSSFDLTPAQSEERITPEVHAMMARKIEAKLEMVDQSNGMYTVEVRPPNNTDMSRTMEAGNIITHLVANSGFHMIGLFGKGDSVVCDRYDPDRGIADTEISRLALPRALTIYH
jgi:hypothetical protein